MLSENQFRITLKKHFCKQVSVWILATDIWEILGDLKRINVKKAAAECSVGCDVRWCCLLTIGESLSICPFLKNSGHEGAECHYFSGMDRYDDFLLLKIHLNIQLCIMTSLHRLTWIIYSWCCAKILKFYFFANSITLWEAHKNRNYTLHSGFKRARQTVHYFCVFWYTCCYIK